MHHKTVEIKVFLTIFASRRNDPDPDTNPLTNESGRAKTYGSRALVSRVPERGVRAKVGEAYEL
jgi:hypothetical protein